MKLWIDDIRERPGTKSEWAWAKHSASAIAMLRIADSLDDMFEEISFDHDLGGDDTTRPVMLWLAEHDVWPKKIVIHTANPVGRQWLAGMARRYAPEGTVIVA